MVVSKLSAGVRSTLRPAGCVRLDERVIAVIGDDSAYCHAHTEEAC